MELMIFGTITFLGFFLMGFGMVMKNNFFLVAGAIIAMLAGTAIASDGLDTFSGNTANDLGNGTLIITDNFTNRNDWTTLSTGRLMFWVGYLGMIAAMLIQLGKTEKVEAEE